MADDGIDIQVNGLREIQEKIQKLPAGMAKKVVYASLRKGANVILKEVRNNAPVRTGTLKKGFKIVGRSKIHKGPEKFGIYLTLKKGRGRSDKKDPFYGKFVEYGYRKGKKNTAFTVSRSDRPGTRRVLRGSHIIPGKFFAKAALEGHSNAAIDAIKDEADTRAQQLITDLGL